MRKFIFKMRDNLLGGSIYRHYEDIIKKTNSDYNNQEDLEQILKYCIDNVPFYENIKESKLKNFPVMNKKIYKEQGLRCISKEYPNYEKLYKASTSGSTGTPMVVYQDKEKKNRCRADLIRAHELIGWNLGDHYYFIRHWVQNYKQSKIKTIAQNVTPVNISEFNDDKKLWLINHIKKHKNSILFGYSSSIVDFMNFLKNKNINGEELKIKVVVCDSDELSVNNKKDLEKTFGCTVINRYENEENGLIAISKPNDDRLYVNYQSLHIELLKPDNDEYVNPGELGRVVITDLYNHSMPLIRYDTGDYAISKDESNNVRLIESFAGRKSDCIYSTNGLIISSVAISGLTEVIYSIEKYQVVQEKEKDYMFYYEGKLTEEEFTELDKRMHSCLGLDANIKYINKNKIENGKNGKFKTLINNYK